MRNPAGVPFAFLALAAVVSAQQPASPPAPKSLIPLAASTLADVPGRYYGENVTVSGVVDRTFSPLAFSIDQDKTRSTGRDVLVLTRRLSAAIVPDSRVTVIGEVVRFDPDGLAEIARDYSVDLAPEIARQYRGRPAVLAASVITSTGIDLARRAPPPMTAEEAEYSAVMKRVASANGALRKALEASDASIAREHAASLVEAFVKTAAFWKTTGKADAVRWADDARQFADSIHRAAAGGKWDEVKVAAASLGQTCQKCHAAYRERLDDGSYRIKMR